MDLLFDEHCTGNCFSNKSEIDKNHTSICVDYSYLSAGTEDEVILDYAIKYDMTIVTKDGRFVKKCSNENVKVAMLKGNYLFLIHSAVKMFGREPDDRLFRYD